MITTCIFYCLEAPLNWLRMKKMFKVGFRDAPETVHDHVYKVILITGTPFLHILGNVSPDVLHWIQVGGLWRKEGVTAAVVNYGRHQMTFVGWAIVHNYQDLVDVFSIQHISRGKYNLFNQNGKFWLGQETIWGFGWRGTIRIRNGLTARKIGCLHINEEQSMWPSIPGTGIRTPLEELPTAIKKLTLKRPLFSLSDTQSSDNRSPSRRQHRFPWLGSSERLSRPRRTRTCICLPVFPADRRWKLVDGPCVHQSISVFWQELWNSVIVLLKRQNDMGVNKFTL